MNWRNCEITCGVPEAPFLEQFTVAALAVALFVTILGA